MRDHCRILLGLALAACAAMCLFSPGTPHLHGAAETRAADWHQSTMADFAQGSLDQIQLVQFGDGALGLAGDAAGYRPLGVYTSTITLADFDFNAVGVQWHAHLPPGTEAEVSLRASADGTAWSPWQAMAEAEQEGEHFYAPTPWMPGRGRYVQYRLTLTSGDPGLSPRVDDVTLTCIDSTAGPTLDEVENVPPPPELQADTVPQPTIISRAGWGADESYRFDAQGHEIRPPEYHTAQKIIIHHSVTPNGDPNPPATVRAIYYYHAVTLGWGDIGYNYLVDWHGNVYEGRYGGPDVAGVHTGGYNSGSVGICGMGTYGNTANSESPSAELLTGLIDLSAWKCNRSMINPSESSFFIDRTTPNMAGHRDYNATACPGDYLYGELPSIRTQVWNRLSTYAPSYYAEYLSHDTPQAMLSGQSAAVSLMIQNAGTLNWSADGQNPVKLGCRWHEADGGVIACAPLISLPNDVSYGHTVQLDNVPLDTPVEPGDYVLEWDLLHEGVGWFSEQGSPSLEVPLTVLDRGSSPHLYMPLVLKGSSGPTPPPPYVEGRALWVPRWSYQNQTDVETIVNKAASANFNILLFQVRGQGDAYYESQYEPWADRLSGTLGQDPSWDPLAVAVNKGHAKGLQVHAYVNVYTAWLGTTPPPASTTPQHMYHRFNDLYGNEWVQWDEGGNPMGLNSSYLFASPGHPAVADHIVQVCKDIVEKYDVDGLHLDYVRYAGPYYSHDPVSEQRFQQAQPIAWADWQRAQITELVSRLYDEVTAVRPDVVLSVAAWPIYQDEWGWVTYGGVKYDGYNGYYQDSRGWLQSGKADFLAPMLYGTSVQDYLDRFQILINDFVAESYGRHIYAGIHAGYNSFSELDARIQIARQAGAQGQAIFAYSLLESNDYWDELRNGPYAQPAQVPAMPWKASPTPPPTPRPTEELVINGSFESYAAWQIPSTPHPAAYSTVRAHTGSRSMRTGIVNPQNNVYSYSSAWQAISVPADALAVTLRFWEYPASQETMAAQTELLSGHEGDPRLMATVDDAQYFLILDEGGNWLATLLWQRSNAQTWLEHSYDLTSYAGRTIHLHLGTLNDGEDGVSSMFVDDVSVEAAYGP